MDKYNCCCASCRIEGTKKIEPFGEPSYREKEIVTIIEPYIPIHANSAIEAAQKYYQLLDETRKNYFQMNFEHNTYKVRVSDIEGDFYCFSYEDLKEE